MGASYLDEDRLERSIAAIATASGPGAIGIVRVSGGDAINIGAQVFSRPDVLLNTPSHTLVVGKIDSASHGTVDHVLAAVMRAPRTYTGENTVEFHTHGGPLQTESVLRVLAEAGALSALPGEFTFRAFINGRIDLTQAESVVDLIAASTNKASQVALAANDGMLRRRLESMSDRISTLRARMEASIDFIDDDIPEAEQPILLKAAEEIISDVDDLVNSYSVGRLLRHGARVVITGPPNVGKSSLFNAILESSRAIVTDIPGTTRDTVTETVNIGEIPVILADTAGMRESSDPIETEGIRRTAALKETADLVLEVRDAGGEFDLGEPDGSTLLVLNKIDLLEEEEIEGLRRKLPAAIPISAREGHGLSGLCAQVADKLAGAWLSGREIAITRERHHEALTSCGSALADVRRCLTSGEPLELAAVELRSAGNSIDELVGRVYDEDVINRIFGEFCIGK
jgi:tRNA modification GTPase